MNMQVEVYQVTYEDVEKYIDPEDIPDGKIALLVKSEYAKIEARIKYEGFQNWTEWISSDIPVSVSQI